MIGGDTEATASAEEEKKNVNEEEEEEEEEKEESKKGREQMDEPAVEEKNITEAVKGRVSAALGSSTGRTVELAASACGEREPTTCSRERRSKLTSASRASLDYSRFADIGDSDDDDDEDDPFRSGAGVTAGMGARFDEGVGPVYEIDESQLPESLKENNLWNTVLRIAGGDVAKALELVQNPDELQAHPEMQELFPEEEECGNSDEASDDDDSSSPGECGEEEEAAPMAAAASS